MALKVGTFGTHCGRFLLAMLSLQILLTVLPAAAQDEPEERHSRVGDPRYWTPECFKRCYLTYLRCVGRTLPPKKYNNIEMVRLFKDKTLDYHTRVEGCSAQYHDVIHIEEDARRQTELNKLNQTVGLTNNFDLCVFTQCGAGGYYGSFNINYMKYSGILSVIKKKLDPDYEFYFEMNAV